MGYRTHADLQNSLDEFLSKYEILRIYIPPEKPIRNHVSQRSRVCRFCEKGYPDVTFKHDPHIIPELFGKNYGVSDFECDNCNNYFSRYENALADYLGLVRTFYAVDGKGSIPTFKSPKESLIARMLVDQNNKKKVTISNLNPAGLHINTESGLNTITYTKNSYIPVNVYKALLKISLTILPANQVNSYSMMFDFISNEQNHPAYVQFAKVLSYTTDYRIDFPRCYLFQKKTGVLNVPSHFMKLYFENFIYQIFIPYHTTDLSMYDIGSVEIEYCPPFITKKTKTTSNFGMEYLDFTSTVKTVGEIGKLSFNVDPEFYKNNYMIDEATGEKSHFIPENISKISIFKIE
jgi:hypothetical protein